MRRLQKQERCLYTASHCYPNWEIWDKIIPLLSDPASHGGDPGDAFDVVVPSMPGYGFSDHATQRGLDVLSIGDMWATLMSENLSYPRFGAQGGDWGASVTAKLGFSHGDKVIGIHSTSVTRPTPYMGPGSRELSEAEKGLLQRREDWTAAKGVTLISRAPSPRPSPTG